jgi:hypothetical protein
MSISLQFHVQAGDLFNYQSTFTRRSGGKTSSNSSRSAQRVVEASGDRVQFVDPDDPERLVSVVDGRGRPVDFLQDGVSIKDDLPEDVWDISNRLIFPDRPVNLGDAWEVNDGHVHLTYQLTGTSQLKGREAAEIRATSSGYGGPILFWVELATGMLLRQEYTVGGRDNATTTVTERV